MCEQEPCLIVPLVHGPGAVFSGAGPQGGVKRRTSAVSASARRQTSVSSNSLARGRPRTSGNPAWSSHQGEPFLRGWISVVATPESRLGPAT